MEESLEEEEETNEEEGTRRVKLTEENGVVPQLDCNLESWIVAEGWPSWSFVLKALGCKDLHTVVKGLTLEELLELRATSLDNTRVHSWTHVRRLLETKSSYR